MFLLRLPTLEYLKGMYIAVLTAYTCMNTQVCMYTFNRESRHCSRFYNPVRRGRETLPPFRFGENPYLNPVITLLSHLYWRRCSYCLPRISYTHTFSAITYACCVPSVLRWFMFVCLRVGLAASTSLSDLKFVSLCWNEVGLEVKLGCRSFTCI